MTRTKQNVMDDTCALLGIPFWRVSTGSTEPKDYLLAVANSLGIPIELCDSKPELAMRIVEASGEVWLPFYESQGATITRYGLEAVERSVQTLLGSQF
jgi:hypothetical protein